MKLTHVLTILFLIALMFGGASAQTAVPTKETRSFTERFDQDQPPPMTEEEKQKLRESVANSFLNFNTRFLNTRIRELESPQQWNWLKPASNRKCNRKHTSSVIFGGPFNNPLTNSQMSPMRR